MNFYLEYILAAVVYTQCFAGIILNLIILAAIFLKWKTLGFLQPYYKILSCLVMSRILSFSSSIFYHNIAVFYPWVLLDVVTLVTIVIKLVFLYHTNLWFATVLCVFYCVKITSYNWKVLIFFKTKLSIVVPWLLLASLIISLFCSLPLGFNFVHVEQINITNDALGNMTVYNKRLIKDLHRQFVLVLLGSCPPFLILCITLCLLLHSLWMHTRRMRSSGSGFQSQNLESRFNAVKNISFFLVLQIIYFIVMTIISSGRMDKKSLRLVASIVSLSPPFFHSLYIIYSNGELKKTCFSMFSDLSRDVHCIVCYQCRQRHHQGNIDCVGVRGPD